MPPTLRASHLNSDDSQDISNLQWPEDYPFPKSVEGRGRDFKCVSRANVPVASYSRSIRACWFMAMEIGVSSIPVSEVRPFRSDSGCVSSLSHAQFYCKEHVNIGESFARFAFCKDLDTLSKAAERLQGLSKFMRR